MTLASDYTLVSNSKGARSWISIFIEKNILDIKKASLLWAGLGIKVSINSSKQKEAHRNIENLVITRLNGKYFSETLLQALRHNSCRQSTILPPSFNKQPNPMIISR
jgi:hypothetical protein